MSCRSSALPVLPGFSTNPNLYKTHFGRRPIFDHSGDVRILVDKITPTLPGKIHERYPSIYTKGDVGELPSWIAFDKQILTFNAYFQETLHETRNSPFIIKKCKIYFYLEDGTVKINETKIMNSGCLHGNILCRGRVNLPPPKDDLFYDIADFNVGKELEIYARVYKLIDCDKFTRNFLNRLGIPVPDPLICPEDPYIVDRQKDTVKFAKKPNSKIDKYAKMYANDRKVLRFYAYWDDRHTVAGYLHDLTIQYYLMDDTIEIIENDGKLRSLLIKRGKIPKSFTTLPDPGFFDTSSVLNVLGKDKYRYKIDLLNPGRNYIEYYSIIDFVIGAAINIYGRKVVIVDCDVFTKNYYLKIYGISDFTPIKIPKDEDKIIAVPLHKRKLPPWNGYGSFSDSAQNCVTVEPKAQLRDVKQFLELDRDGLDSRILRYKSYNIIKGTVGTCGRKFIVCFYLADDTISVHEVEGLRAGPTFMARGKVVLPGQEVFTSEEPDYYLAQHFYVGATINLNGFIFVLTDADEYALRYMELHCEKFPKSNIKLIMKNVREKIVPIYIKFTAELLPKDQPVLPFDTLRTKLGTIMGENWTEQEMLTVARHYSNVCREERHSREYIKSLVRLDLRRGLWQNFERMKECFKEFDINRTGYLSKNDTYTLIKACKLPLNKLLIDHMLDVLKKNDKCEIEEKDLFDFIDENVGQRHDVGPVCQMYELWWATEPEPVSGKLVDWCRFLKDINIESEKQQTAQENKT